MLNVKPCESEYFIPSFGMDFLFVYYTLELMQRTWYLQFVHIFVMNLINHLALFLVSHIVLFRLKLRSLRVFINERLQFQKNME